MQNNYSLDKASLIYFISDRDMSDTYGTCTKFTDDLYVSHSATTTCITAEKGSECVCLIGLCVDSEGKLDKNQLPDFILDGSRGDPDAVAKILKRFAGNFIAVYRDNSSGKTFVYTDASGSLPAFYSTGEGETAVGMFDRHVADFCGYVPDKGTEYGPYNTLPYNITPYEKVKALLPNTHVCLETKKTTRVPSLKFSKTRNEIRDETISRVRNIITEYRKDYDFSSAITSGYDSRLNMAFCVDTLGKDTVGFYTINHASYSGFDRGEVEIPSQICNNLKLNYRILNESKADHEVYDYIESNLSEPLTENANVEYFRALTDIDWIIRSGGINSYLHGNVIGQIGKSGMCKDFPVNKIDGKTLASELKFYSLSAAKQFDYWIETIDNKDNLMDYFVIESRLARWAAKSIAIGYLLGITTLNIYNCGYLIDLWITVPRARRLDRKLHKGIIKKIQPGLLKYPFPGSTVKNALSRLPVPVQKRLYYAHAKSVMKEHDGQWH